MKILTILILLMTIEFTVPNTHSQEIIYQRHNMTSDFYITENIFIGTHIIGLDHANRFACYLPREINISSEDLCINNDLGISVKKNGGTNDAWRFRVNETNRSCDVLIRRNNLGREGYRQAKIVVRTLCLRNNLNNFNQR